MGLPNPCRPLLLCTCIACLLLAGCSRGPRIAPVRGRVTYNGKPVTTGKIWFYPENGRPALGVLAEDGTYTLTTDRAGDGALVGTHRVAIQSTTVGPGSMAGPKSRDEEVAMSQQGNPGKWLAAGKVEWLVPQTYSRPETSGLSAKVEDTNNEINFDIPAGK
jgi:hypothetical protein